MSKVGRPTKRTPTTIDKLTKALRQGATYKLACQYAGVHYSKFRQWMKAGEEGDPELSEFVEAIKKAEGDAVVGWLEKIETAAKRGEWQAAAWKLERRYPHDYGRQIHDVNVNMIVPDKPVEQYSDEEIDRALNELELQSK